MYKNFTLWLVWSLKYWCVYYVKIFYHMFVIVSQIQVVFVEKNNAYEILPYDNCGVSNTVLFPMKIFLHLLRFGY